jgi:hypothetical protein
MPRVDRSEGFDFGPEGCNRMPLPLDLMRQLLNQRGKHRELIGVG